MHIDDENFVTCSLVIYKNPKKLLLNAINSFLNINLKVKLFLIDNSPTDILKDIVTDSRVEYIHNPSNPGFGAAHNLAIKKVLADSKYHLILNPDIYFDEGVIENIVDYMNKNSDIGVIMPQILYPDGKIQYLAKLLPTPIDFIVRRLLPIKSIKKRFDDRFELRNSGYKKIIDAPFLSGCFLVFRTDVLYKIDGFDEKIFMYTEDIDICRRIIKSGYRSVFFPEVFVYHDHEHKSFTTRKNFKTYLSSAIYYFNKWGWFFDKDRREINTKTLSQF